MPQTIVPPPQVEWAQDWIWPSPSNSIANATAPTNGAHAHSGLELAVNTNDSGTPALVNVGKTSTLMLGATSAFANQDQICSRIMAAQAQLSKLPAGTILEEHRRIHWWSWRQRHFGAALGASELFYGVHLRGNQVGTGSWGLNTFPTTGHGIGLSMDGAGAWRFVRKVSAAANAGASELLALVWPRALTDWTEVWFVILGATAGGASRFQLYIDRVLVLERLWPDDGETGSLNPTLEEAFGATSFVWTARCAGLTFAGTRLLIAGWRYRQGMFFVDGSPLSGV